MTPPRDASPPTDPWAPVYGRLVAPALAHARGDRSHAYVRGIERVLALPAADAARWSAHRLARVVRHAYETVPFYARRMREVGYDPSLHRRPADLAAVPALTKRDAAAEAAALVSSRYDGRRLVGGASGGTTGVAFHVRQTRRAVAIKDAAATALRALLGWPPGVRAAALWGAAQDAPHERPEGWRRDVHVFARARTERSCYLPATGLSDAKLDEYADVLERFAPAALQAYPSAADLLARRLAARGRRLAVPVVLLTSEPVFADQRARVAEAFGASVPTFYGARECGWIAAERTGCARLHVNTAGVHLEAEPDGRLLVTDLVNLAAPLVRYEIGDRGTLDPDPCPCGDPRPVLATLEGRLLDVFLLPSGRRVSGAAVDSRGPREGFGTLDVQLVQDARDVLDVNFVRGPDHRPGDDERLRERLDRLFFGELEIRLHPVERIAPGPNGKVRWCVCNVKDASA